MDRTMAGRWRFSQARKLAILGFGVLASFAAGCDEPEPAPQSVALPRPVAAPALRPDTVIGELFVARPSDVFERVRALSPTPFLPRSVGMLAVMVLGLEPAAAGLIDGDAPLVGALVVSEAGAGAVVGVRTTSPREMRARLTTGANAAYRAEEHGAVVTLETRGSDGLPALALADDYLLVSRRMQDAIDAGAYLARAVARRDRPPHDVVFDIEGSRVGLALAATLDAEWTAARAWLERSALSSRDAHGGQRADLADPDAVIRVFDGTFSRVLQLVRDAERARAFIDVSEHVASAGVTVDVPAGTPSASVLAPVHGGATGGIDVPDDVPAFIVASAGVRVGETLAATVAEVLGERVRKKDRPALSRAGALLDEAFHGPVTLARLPAEGDDWAWALTGKPSTVERFDKAVRSLERVLRFPAVTALLRSDAASASPQRKSARVARVNVAGEIHDGVAVCLVTSGEPHRVFKAFDARRRIDDSFVSTRLEAFGAHPFMAAAVRLASDGGSAGPGWAVVAAGRRDLQAYVQVDAEPSAARALLSVLSGD